MLTKIPSWIAEPRSNARADEVAAAAGASSTPVACTLLKMMLALPVWVTGHLRCETQVRSAAMPSSLHKLRNVPVKGC